MSRTKKDGIEIATELQLAVGEPVPERWAYDPSDQLYLETNRIIRTKLFSEIIEPFAALRPAATRFAESIRVGMKYRTIRIETKDLVDIILALRAVADHNGIVHGSQDMFPQWSPGLFRHRLELIADVDGFVSGNRPFVKKPHHKNDLGFFLVMFPHPVWTGDVSAIVTEEPQSVDELMSMKYDQYLGTRHWQAVREAAIERAARKCQVCGGNVMLNVHHNTYDRRGEELPTDLVVLCQECHRIFHKFGRMRPPVDRNYVHRIWFWMGNDDVDVVEEDGSPTAPKQS